MEVEFSVKAHLVVTPGKDDDHVRFRSARYCLGVSKNLDRSKYIENELPNEHGCKAVTVVLVNALIGNMRAAHDKGYWNDAEHLRYIIKELEEGLVTNFETSVTED